MARPKRTDSLDRHREHIRCSGGQRDGYWYDSEFWAASVAAEQHRGAGPRTSTYLGYVETPAVEAHPRIDRLSGTVWRWNPDRAAELAATTTDRSTTP